MKSIEGSARDFCLRCLRAIVVSLKRACHAHATMLDNKLDTSPPFEKVKPTIVAQLALLSQRVCRNIRSSSTNFLICLSLPQASYLTAFVLMEACPPQLRDALSSQTQQELRDVAGEVLVHG